MDIHFDLPKNRSNVIKVIGVGGGGSNAINHMFRQGIDGVDFVVCNTDAQALENSPVPTKVQLGMNLTEGLGAGANPEVGEQAALESFEDLKALLDTNTKMAFITAGMGGGTGTGAAPVIAKQARDMDILTVGIVTIPFKFEGKNRCKQAMAGVNKLRQSVDSLIVIDNDKLREVYGNLGFKSGFSKADEVLTTAARGIAEVITNHYTQNIDLRDAKTVLSNSGTAIMGSAQASGENRAHDAIVHAMDSPLLNDNKISGAQNVLLLIVSGSQEITLDEIGEINDHIQDEAGNSANIIMGVGEDEDLGEAVSVTIIATGFNKDQQNEIVNAESNKIIHNLEEGQTSVLDLTPGHKQVSRRPEPQDEVEEEEETASWGFQKRDTLISARSERKIHRSDQRQNDPEGGIRHAERRKVQPERRPRQTERATNRRENPGNTQEGSFKRPERNTNELESRSRKPERNPVQPRRNPNPVQRQEPLKEERPGLIPTSEFLRDIEVNYKEVIYDEDDFVFVDSPDSNQVDQEYDEGVNDLIFDFPLSGSSDEDQDSDFSEDERYSSNEDDSFEASHNEESLYFGEAGSKRYDLDDYLEKESELIEAQPEELEEPRVVSSQQPNRVERRKPEVKRTEERSDWNQEDVAEEEKDLNPLNSSISEGLAARASARRERLKKFNYKFRKNGNIEEVEKQPAYKRAGVDLGTTSGDSESGAWSRSSVRFDEDNKPHINKNNSYLHDNVD